MMATLYGNTVWEGLSTETKPNIGTGASNGQFFKEMDTGESYHLIDGTWTYVNLGFAFVKATKSGRATTGAGGTVDITFNTAFIDDEYSIALSVVDDGGKTPTASKSNRTASGFRLHTRNSTSGQYEGNVEVSWLCTRDYNP